MPMRTRLEGSLDGAGGGLVGAGTAEENLSRAFAATSDGALEQARLAGPDPGNKSEMAIGYATLYGDMAGGFAVIKDVPKTLVYELVRKRNRAPATTSSRPVIESPPAPSSGRTSSTATRCRPTSPRPDSRGLRRTRPRRDEIVAAAMHGEVVDG